MKNPFIEIRGAREHNLKNIDVNIPHGKLVVLTGVSGSGKTSLAFETVFAEGQRRYMESLSAYARQFLGQYKKPEVDSIEGLSPSIAIEQKSSASNPRSTVGTLTEIADYLRLLFARIGQAFCPQCHQEIVASTPQQIVDTILKLPTGSKIMVLAPVIRGQKGKFAAEIEHWRRQGFVRARVDGDLVELAAMPNLHARKNHTIDLVIDRLVLAAGIKQRLTEAVELGLRLAKGLVTVHRLETNSADSAADIAFSQIHACQQCDWFVPEISPRLFSFNAPYGACHGCSGLGQKIFFKIEKILDTSKKLEQALVLHCGRFHLYPPYLLSGLQNYFETYSELRIEQWPVVAKKVLLTGGQLPNKSKLFMGLYSILEDRYAKAPLSMRTSLDAWREEKLCPECQGQRLSPTALSVKISNQNIAQVCALSIQDALQFFKKLVLSRTQSKIAQPILKEITSRLSFLVNVGLNYLSLDRSSQTLSGGEAQRIRLATQIGSSLQGVIYVLDEPSIGLHARDNARLIATLKQLRDVGNTVLVVEHDEETMQQADWIVDIGPGAGVHGGTVVASDTPEHLPSYPQSLTGAYLGRQRQIAYPPHRRQVDFNQALVLRGAHGHNLKHIDVVFPLHALVCVTGVSGSGKSTLVNDTLIPLLKDPQLGSVACQSMAGHHLIDGLIEVDQSPIGRSPRSNPATYTGLFTIIRDIMGMLPEARARGYGPGRFSFNVPGGRCASCEGDGVLRVEMHFLPDVFVTCETCEGARYNRETLEITYRGQNIADILAMTADQAVAFWSAYPKIARRAQALVDVGLGYITLGQAATTLSGGEAQRVKLAKELARTSASRYLFVLDEPTTGLHFEDVRKLLAILNALVERGNSVVVIEHHMDVIKSADYIIDLGPEGGALGGQVVATGTPEQLVHIAASHTGRHLQAYLT